MKELLFFGVAEGFLLIFILIFSLLPLVLAIAALIDLFKRNFQDKSTDKILLILLIIFAPFIGSIIYFVALKNNYPLNVSR